MVFRLDELGWQVRIPPAATGAYHGRESVRPTTEASQSGIYNQAIRYLACDASVRSTLFFLLRDEPDLDRWQAGLIRADSSLRSSYGSVKATVAQTGGRCPGRMRSWRHTTKVTGAKVRFPKKRVLPARRLTVAVVANAQEDANVEAGLYRGSRRVLRVRTTVKAYRSKVIRIRNRFRSGRYTIRVTFRASLNTTRANRFTKGIRIR
jgi:hypothetical protein